MSFQQGLSGLNVASASLDVIGNNIANSTTVGFKQSRAEFSDVYASALNGSGSNQIGIGAKVADIAQQFTQGNISSTSNPLDVAINGDGFFRMDNGGSISYSRNGQFHIDKSGYIVNGDDLNLTGYSADVNGNITGTAPEKLKISAADIPPKVTSSFGIGANLDSRTTVPAVIPTFNANDPTTFANTTSGTIYDSLGNSHIFSLFFQKNAANSWDAFATVDGTTTAAGVPIGVTLGGGASQPITFSTNGLLLTPAAPINVSVNLATIDPTLGATSPLNFTLDFSESTQFGKSFGVNSLTQDGFAPGRLGTFAITEDGLVKGNYTNGASKTLGQIVLGNFINPQGLASIGNNQFVETASSGQPLVGAPKTGSLGGLKSAAVEDSNVDLTTELVKMITAQRTYQANAKTIETQDAILQTLVNL